MYNQPMDLRLPFFDLEVDSQPGQICLTPDGPSLRSFNPSQLGAADNSQFLNLEADAPWRCTSSSPSPSLSTCTSDFIAPEADYPTWSAGVPFRSASPDDNRTDDNPISLAQELDSILESRAAQIRDQHHRHYSDNGSSSRFVSPVNPALSDAEVANVFKEYGVFKACGLTWSVTGTIKMRTPEQFHAVKEALGLDMGEWRSPQVLDRSQSSDATPTDIMAGYWFASSSQDHMVSQPLVQPTELEPVFIYSDGLGGSSEPPGSTCNDDSQDLRSSEATSKKCGVAAYLRRHYQKGSRLSPPTMQKVCKRGGVRKPADEHHHGTEDRGRTPIKTDRESSHRRRPKAKRRTASHPNASFVGIEIQDRPYAYALLNDDQPNIAQEHALPGNQPNAQSPVRSKIPFADDPYDARYSTLPSPYYSSDNQSDTEVSENEKMVWMVVPNGFPCVAPLLYV